MVISKWLILLFIGFCLVACEQPGGRDTERQDSPENSHKGQNTPNEKDEVLSKNESEVKKSEESRSTPDVKFIAPPVKQDEDELEIRAIDDETTNLGSIQEGDDSFYEPEVIVQEEILTFVEEMPEFPGGNEKLMAFLKDNVKYPAMEKEEGIQGKVYVRFVVDEEGSVSAPKILRGVTGAPNFDKEVIRVINKMPKWIPGKMNGKNVKTYMTLPVIFKLT